MLNPSVEPYPLSLRWSGLLDIREKNIRDLKRKCISSPLSVHHPDSSGQWCVMVVVAACSIVYIYIVYVEKIIQ